MGLAGVAGVAVSGAVVLRRRRTQREYDPEALRARLHERLAASRAGAPPPAPVPPPPRAR